MLSLLLAGVIAVPLMLLAVVPVVVVGVLSGVRDLPSWLVAELSDPSDLGPAGFLYVNLSLIALIPAAVLSIWVAHRVRPKYVTSVQGGMRWRWLMRCVATLAPLWALYLGGSALLEDPGSPRPAQWLWLLLIVVCLTPFQSAAEEYFFRGWMMQSLGSWFASRQVGLVVTLLVSSATFAAAHGGTDPWVIGNLAVFALTAGIATWRTGGLEAAITLHAVNNVGLFVVVLTQGGWREAFVSEDTQSTPLVFAIAVLVHGVALALILWQARRAGIDRFYRPAEAQHAPQVLLRPG